MAENPKNTFIGWYYKRERKHGKHIKETKNS